METRPRFANHANTVLISAAISVRIGKDDDFVSLEFAPKFLPQADIEAAFAKCRYKLADNYGGALTLFFTNHPEFESHQANSELLAGAWEREGLVAPMDDDQAELVIHPGSPNHVVLRKSVLALQAEGDEYRRQQLAEKIIANAPVLVLDGKDREADRRKKKAREEWKERIRAMDLESLKRVKEKQSLSQGDVSDAQAIVQNADRERQNELVDRQFQKIPELYYPANKDISVGVPWSPVLIHKLPRMEIERLFRIYGQQQINERLAQSQQKK